MKTGLLIPIEQRFIPSNLFQISILRSSKLDDYFLRPIAFQPVTILMFEGSIATSNLSKMLMVVSSRSSLLTVSETTVTSKHSRLEYCYPPTLSL